MAAMKRLAGSPFPDTSPTRNRSRSPSRRKKSKRSPPTTRAGSITAEIRNRPSPGNADSGRGRRPELDAARRLELAREPGGGLALLLEPLAERPALPVGLGQRAAQGGRVDDPEPEGRREAVEQERELPVRREAAAEQRGAEAERQERRANHPHRRGEDDDQAAGDGEGPGLGPRRPARPDEHPAVEDVLERLGVDLDAREALPERREVLVPEAERRHAHEDQLPLEALAAGPRPRAPRPPRRTASRRAA